MANRQEIVCTYIYENYVQFNRLRHDVISNKVQIFATDGLACQETLRWRDITTADVNDIVCDCSAQSGLQITAREVLAVLQSHRIPDVHPLREYVLNCRPYTTDQPDWIAWLASRVTVAGGEEEQKLWVTCFRKWFVAMVASWLSDEVVNQQVLVLVGKQGIFKTTWLEQLPHPGERGAAPRRLFRHPRRRLRPVHDHRRDLRQARLLGLHQETDEYGTTRYAIKENGLSK